MKLFFKKIILFLFPILLLSYPLDRWVSYKYKSKNIGELSVWNDIYDGNIDADMVINGSSRAWVHFNPFMIEEQTAISSCYNLGFNAHNFPLQYLRYLEYRKYNPKPKIIIQEIEGISLSIDSTATELEQLMPYMLFNETMRQHTKTNGMFNLFDFYVPFLRYYGEIDHVYSAIDTTDIKIKGYKGQDRAWNDDYQNARKTMDGYTSKIDSTVLKSFENFLEDCKRENIKVVFVQPPVHIYGQEFINNYEEAIGWIEDISKRHDINFYNFSNDSLCYQQKYFYNTRHLNKEGSTIFTQKLIPIIKKELEGIDLNTENK